MQSRPPITIHSPLIGDGYVDANGCCRQSAHTRALLTINGQRALAQRFAIDWIRIDRRGRAFVGAQDKNKDWLIYGDPVLAAAPGVVISVVNNVPENTPPHPLANLTARTVSGNRVVEDFGGGRYAMYAHMQTGSVAVRVGQRLRAGQFLGRVGNTGNSSAPHLHFQVTSGPDPLTSNGVPYLFDRFRLTAEVLNLDAFIRDVNPQPARLGPARPPVQRHAQLPMQTDVITFGG